MIKGKLKTSKIELEIGRFYLPGLVIREVCPHCSHKFKVDLNVIHPYDIKDNGECALTYSCPECEEVLDRKGVLSISLSLKDK